MVRGPGCVCNATVRRSSPPVPRPAIVPRPTVRANDASPVTTSLVTVLDERLPGRGWPPGVAFAASGALHEDRLDRPTGTISHHQVPYSRVFVISARLGLPLYGPAVRSLEPTRLIEPVG